MTTMVVVDRPADWPLDLPGVEVVAARRYLADAACADARRAKVFNLCRSYRYQSFGYYVSLLAEARGHKPMPSIATIQDLKSQTIVRLVSDDLDDLIQSSLRSIQSEEFVLSIYFGRNLAKRHTRLALALYNLFPMPMMRARFVYQKSWQLQGVRPIAANEIPEAHRDFVIESAKAHFAGKRRRGGKPKRSRYDLAILVDPAETMPPSDAGALKRFTRAAENEGFAVEMIGRDDYGRVAEFDALFIRETTNVNHHTFRFARRAEAEGLVVVDDPVSILRCTNKVYLAELLRRHQLPAPATRIISRGNVEAVLAELGTPCVLKQPDSAFSQGVVKVDDTDAYRSAVARLLERSDLIIAQQFLPTDFDWRIGIFDRQPLYACRYYMAARHWQIVHHEADGGYDEGNYDTLDVAEVPPAVVRVALRAANLIGDGLYGVDLKQSGQRSYIIEINDNPNIDAGVEDAVLGDELYRRFMAVMMRRVEARKGAAASSAAAGNGWKTVVPQSS